MRVAVKPTQPAPWAGAVRRPVGFWLLNERSYGGLARARDWARGLHGTYVNAPPPLWGRSGAEVQFSQALDCYVDLGNPAALQVTGDLTLAVSYRVELVNAGQDHILFGKDASTGGRSYVLMLADYSFNGINGLSFYFNGGGSTANTVSDGVLPVAGQDVLAVATYRQSTGHLSLYKDGQLAARNTAGTTAGIPAATASAMIGRRAYTGETDGFTGRIRFAGIWNVALTDREVATFSADPYRAVRPRLPGPLYAISAAAPHGRKGLGGKGTQPTYRLGTRTPNTPTPGL